MTETLSIRMDHTTKRRLESLAKRSHRTQSGLAVEAITAFLESQKWQHNEIQAGIKDLNRGAMVPHGQVAKWLESWGKPDEAAPPQ